MLVLRCSSCLRCPSCERTVLKCRRPSAIRSRDDDKLSLQMSEYVKSGPRKSYTAQVRSRAGVNAETNRFDGDQGINEGISSLYKLCGDGGGARPDSTGKLVKVLNV